jgi:hypothetical protein
MVEMVDFRGPFIAQPTLRGPGGVWSCLVNDRHSYFYLLRLAPGRISRSVASNGAGHLGRSPVTSTGFSQTPGASRSRFRTAEPSGCGPSSHANHDVDDADDASMVKRPAYLRHMVIQTEASTDGELAAIARPSRPVLNVLLASDDELGPGWRTVRPFIDWPVRPTGTERQAGLWLLGAGGEAKDLGRSRRGTPWPTGAADLRPGGASGRQWASRLAACPCASAQRAALGAELGRRGAQPLGKGPEPWPAGGHPADPMSRDGILEHPFVSRG